MKKIQKNSKGITLIALIITIIILLILAGISIAALTQTGLFSRAKQVDQVSKEKQEEENTTLETYENEIDKYLGKNNGETPNEPKEKTMTDMVNDKTIKIGDYVKYTPDKASTGDILKELSTYSGSTENTSSTLTQEIDKDTGLNWRVLDVKDGQVRLISDKPTTSKIALNGYNGYNNAVKLLDDTCSSLYTNSKLTSKVQNLKIEDIQNKMTEKDYTKINSEYGKIYSSTTKYYPNILLKEKEQIVNGTTGTKLGLSEQEELINQTKKAQVDSWTVKYNFWGKAMNEDDFLDDIYYKLFINNENNYSTYWMSSRCTLSYNEIVRFSVRLVNNSSSIGATHLYLSSDVEISISNSFRPVITLNSNVQIDTENSGDGSTAAQGYAIK